MDRKPYPSESQERFIIRLPDGMRDRIADAAKANGRSMNAEIVSRLERSFEGAEDAALVIDQARQIFQLRTDLAVVHMGMVMPRMYIKDGVYREEALRDINSAMDRTGPHAQYLIDLPLDELNELRKRFGYDLIAAKDFSGFKTAAERDAAKAADAA